MYRHCLSIDLGTANDFSVFTLLRLAQRQKPGDHTPLYAMEDSHQLESFLHLVHVERPDLRTTYPAIADLAVEIMNNEEIRGKAYLVVDATGVGLPVVQLMREKGLAPIPITITGGYTVTQSDVTGGYNVPKRDLIAALLTELQTARLKFAYNLPHLEQLKQELLRFRGRTTMRGDATGSADTESTHDDIVMSLAMNCWWARSVWRAELSPPRPSKPKSYDELRHGL